MVQTAGSGKNLLEFVCIKFTIIHLCAPKAGYMGNTYGMFCDGRYRDMVYTEKKITSK